MTLVSHWQEALGMLHLKKLLEFFFSFQIKKVLAFVFFSDLVKLCLYMKVKVRIETRYGYN